MEAFARLCLPMRRAARKPRAARAGRRRDPSTVRICSVDRCTIKHDPHDLIRSDTISRDLTDP
eukprot:2626954-Prymnesium_polylepis.1